MIDVDGVRRLLHDFVADDGRAEKSLEHTHKLLNDKHDPFDRTDYKPGHITASAIVLSADLASAALVNHPRVGRWIQPGGHVEPADPSLVESACREVREETGLQCAAQAPSLVRVDVHRIPPYRREPPHRHFDLTFGFLGQSRETDPAGDSEWMWCPIDELLAYGVEANLIKSIHRTRGMYRLP